MLVMQKILLFLLIFITDVYVVIADERPEYCSYYSDFTHDGEKLDPDSQFVYCRTGIEYSYEFSEITNLLQSVGKPAMDKMGEEFNRILGDIAIQKILEKRAVYEGLYDGLDYTLDDELLSCAQNAGKKGSENYNQEVSKKLLAYNSKSFPRKNTEKQKVALTLNVINALKANALFKKNKDYFKKHDAVTVRGNQDVANCRYEKRKCENDTPFYKDTYQCKGNYDSCIEKANSDKEQRRKVLNDEIAPLYSMISSSPLLFNNIENGSFWDGMMADKLAPSPFMSSLIEKIPDSLINDFDKILDKNSGEDLQKFFEDNAELLNKIVEGSDSNGLLSQMKKENESELKRLDEAALAICNDTGENLHHHPELVQLAMNEYYAKSDSREGLKGRIAFMQGSYCHLLNTKPNEESGISAAAIGGFALLGIGGALQLIPLVGNVTGSGLMIAGTGLLTAGGLALTGLGINEGLDQTNKLKSDVALNSVGLAGYQEILKKKKVRDGTYFTSATDLVLLPFDVLGLKHLAKAKNASKVVKSSNASLSKSSRAQAAVENHSTTSLEISKPVIKTSPDTLKAKSTETVVESHSTTSLEISKPVIKTSPDTLKARSTETVVDSHSTPSLEISGPVIKTSPDVLKARSTIGHINTRETLVSQFEAYDPATDDMRRAWIKLAKDQSATKYVDIENGMLKRINDLGDKEIATALTNVHKKLILNGIEELRKKYPGLDITMYSDFKSLRLALRGKIPPTLQEELTSIFNNAGEEVANLADKLQKSGEISLPEGENLRHWFAGGYGSTADEAGLAAREARCRENEICKNPVRDFSEQKNIDGLNDGRIETDKTRKIIIDGIKDIKSPVPLYNVYDGIEIPSVDLIEVVRKNTNKSPADLAKLISNRFGIEVNSDLSSKMIEYVNNLKRFEPGLWIESRKLATLEDAAYGGFSADFTGMGSFNIEQVARDLAAEKGDVTSLLNRLRKGEESVTEQFNEKKAFFEKISHKAYNDNNVDVKIICSGDDCVTYPTAPTQLNPAKEKEIQESIITEINNSSSPDGFRLAFVPPKAAKESRSRLATHGELIEKEIRKMSIGKGGISLDLAKKLTIAIRMPKSLGKGRVEVIVSGTRKLSDSDRKYVQEIIRRRVKKAIKTANKGKDEVNEYRFKEIKFI